MPDGVTLLVLVAGLGFVLVIRAKLGIDSPTILGGLFPHRVVGDWPVGVQEPDAPRFAVAHLDRLRPGSTGRATPTAGEPADIVDLYERPTDPTGSPGPPRADTPSAGGRGLSLD